jgi:acetyltransferase-like isoleucine patch superfamily enzyme
LHSKSNITSFPISIGTVKAGLLTAGSPFWRLYIRLRGISVGTGFTSIGRPGINLKGGCRIRIGERVTLCNSGMANPLGEHGRCRLATVAAGAELIIGDRVGMSAVLVCCATRIEIGAGTQIGGGAMILNTDFHPRASDATWLTGPAAVNKPVNIGKNCFIGARAMILKGVIMGEGAVVGASAVVTKDVPPGVTIAGNPAAVLS